MDLLDQKTTDELLKSLLAETAKANNELRCAQADLQKAQNRLSFVLAVANALIKR
jgi:hypothetical protein